MHAAELGTWYAAQAAALKERLGFRLALTVGRRCRSRTPIATSARARIGAGCSRAPTCSCPSRSAPAPRWSSKARLATASASARPASMSSASPRPDADAAVRRRTPGPLDRPARVGEGAPGRAPRCGAAAAPRPRGRARADRGHGAGGGPLAGRGPRLRPRGSRGAARLGAPRRSSRAVYAAASCLVLGSIPVWSWEEQFGMVLVEAMAAHVPVLASASGAIPEVVGESGTLFAPGDWVGLADALAGPARRRRPARAGRPTRSSWSATRAGRRGPGCASSIRGAGTGLSEAGRADHRRRDRDDRGARARALLPGAPRSARPCRTRSTSPTTPATPTARRTRSASASPPCIWSPTSENIGVRPGDHAL